MLKEKVICASCVGEDCLSGIVENDGKERECSYCEELYTSLTLEELAAHIEMAFESHYIRTSSEPNSWQYAMLKDKEIEYDWEREGEPTVYAIMNAADISEVAAQDIQTILEDEHFDFDETAMGNESAFSSDTYYEEIMPGGHEWQEEWRSFEKLIKTEARFFSRTAAAQLGALFNDIDQMRTSKNLPLVVDAGPDTELTHLYRARVFQSDTTLKKALIRPDLELSAPPSQYAAAGRMNAKGISVFYGATNAEIALAEVRPPVGSQVALTRFDIIRPIRLLDLSALSDVREHGSIFDPSYVNRLGRMVFLRTLSELIARPVMPDGQDTEYLPTQAVADFLATESEVPLDGILFPSVQVGGAGLNVVLFRKAARCLELEIPEGADLSASTYSTYEDGREPDYTVIEEISPSVEEEIEEKLFSPFEFDEKGWSSRIESDNREITLKVDLGSMEIHVVGAVQVNTSKFEVKRHRWEKKEPPF